MTIKVCQTLLWLTLFNKVEPQSAHEGDTPVYASDSLPKCLVEQPDAPVLLIFGCILELGGDVCESVYGVRKRSLIPSMVLGDQVKTSLETGQRPSGKRAYHDKE